MKISSALLFLLAFPATCPLSAGEAGTDIDRGWEDASLYRANDAQQDFIRARKGGTTEADRREADFGEGVSLLNVQPKTDQNLDKAVALFQSVRQNKADDDLGIASLYFMARIEQYQRLPANPIQAAIYYRKLLASHPGHFWAGQAAIKLAMIEIYDAKTPAEQNQVLDRYEKLASTLADAQSQRDLYFVLGRSYLNLRLSPEKALADLLQTQRFGYSLSGIRADNYVRIAELARQTNQSDTAILYYNKFAAEFPFDSRVYTIKIRLKALTNPTVAAKS